MRKLLFISLLAACSTNEHHSMPAKHQPPALAHATQADLSHDLELAQQRGTWLETRAKWQGQKLRWTVIRQKLLCQSAELCNVQAFPIRQAATDGWMPELVFAKGQYEALAAKCGDAEQCELTFEGTLSKLDVSAEEPTRLRFTDVKLVAEQTAQK